MLFKRNSKTKIVVRCDAGFPNTLFIRGEGIPHLSWEKGLPLKNVKKDEWVFELTQPFKEGQFKILINDSTFELGKNHPILSGHTIKIEPRF